MSNVSKKKIAITGTIGSGKSTVSKYIANTYPMISSDAIVDDLYCDKSFIRQVNKLIYNIDSDVLDKKLLAQKVFSNEKSKADLEALIHPLVKVQIKSFLEEHQGFVFAEVPLLFEANFVSLFDIIIVVASDEDIIIKRLIENRNYSEEEAYRRINNQFSVAYKIEQADYVIYNNSSIKALKSSVDEVLEKMKKGD